MKIYNDKKITFSSGLNPNIRQIIKNSKVSDIEFSFLKQYNIDVNFSNNKILASSFAMVLNIFETLSEKYKLPVSSVPPRIRIFKRKNLIDKNFSNSFCIPDSGVVLKNELPFEIRSIFMKNISNFFETNKKYDIEYLLKKRSSPHFLSEIIHEWCHNVHLDLIFKKYGYEGVCPYAKSIYRKTGHGLAIIDKFSKYKPNNSTKVQLYLTLGKYAATSDSKMEIFAEGFTKLITNSIDSKNLTIFKNPLDDIKYFPNKIKKFIESQFY